jgi:anion-transporting  ArsA/GET3 family ATPase
LVVGERSRPNSHPSLRFLPGGLLRLAPRGKHALEGLRSTIQQMPDRKTGAWPECEGGGAHIYVCVGPGGVGKTTVSAALALGLAASGRRVAVVTIDPARRLATALGLQQLGGEPQRIDPERLLAGGLEVKGELWAMTLDVKSTLDRLIGTLAPDSRTREEILANRIYRDLSSAVAGSQELSAVAKLYELHHQGGFDTIVLDTPPSRHALDFLDAPSRLERFLGGRALAMFLAPGGLAARLIGRPTLLVFSIFARVAGIDLLGDLTAFFRALAGTVEGIAERARGVGELLRDAKTTSFLIVTSAEREPAREAVSLREHLAAEGMPFGGLIVNRVHLDGLAGHAPEEVIALLAPELGERLARRVAENLADFDVLARRDEQSIAHLRGAFGDERPILIPHLDEDVQDVDSLVKVAAHLLG